MITLYNPEITASYNQELKPTSVSITGECILPDATMCKVTEELNGPYELQMAYLPNGVNSEHIRADAILGVKCPLRNSIGENYFRIYRVVKDIYGHINVYARQISSDLSYIAIGKANITTNIEVWDFSGFVGVLREHAVDNMPFTFVNGVNQNKHRMRFWSPASARAYLGGEGMIDPDRTALQLYAGEYVWDKFRIAMYVNRGIDRNYELHYGVNISGITVDDDLDSVYSAFVLYWSGTMNGQPARIYSAVAESAYSYLFPNRRTQLVDWTSMLTYETEPPEYQVQSELSVAAVQYAQTHGNDSISKIDVDVVAVGIDEIYLGDRIRLIYQRNGISLNKRMKVVSYEWDVLLQRYSRVTLGAVKETLASIIAKR